MIINKGYLTFNAIQLTKSYLWNSKNNFVQLLTKKKNYIWRKVQCDSVTICVRFNSYIVVWPFVVNVSKNARVFMKFPPFFLKIHRQKKEEKLSIILIVINSLSHVCKNYINCSFIRKKKINFIGVSEKFTRERRRGIIQVLRGRRGGGGRRREEKMEREWEREREIIICHLACCWNLEIFHTCWSLEGEGEGREGEGWRKVKIPNFCFT